MTLPWILTAIVFGLLGILAWDFGRRWLVRQDYKADLAALKHDYESNKSRTDKAISNLAAQTQESITTLEKKCNTLLSGGMLRGQPGRRLG